MKYSNVCSLKGFVTQINVIDDFEICEIPFESHTKLDSVNISIINWLSGYKPLRNSSCIQR